jgi:site-specific recombinase XerD
MRFTSEVSVLKAFCRAMGDTELAEVTPQSVQAFLDGQGPVTSYWHQKLKILAGFYRFALSRAYLATSPLPRVVPKCPPPMTPYIYSVAELRRLLEATEQLSTPMSPLQAITFRTLLLLLYGSAMRVSEALALTLVDVDLAEGLITVRDTKFFKTRWVPIGPKLTASLTAYADRRRRLPLPAGEASAFFVTRTGHPLSYDQVGRLFIRVRQHANVQREAQARYQPRLHDLRHTAIVHRVVAWHQADRNVGRLLLPLSTYVGHGDITSTQRYLSMTPELLAAASRRFALYAQVEEHHET